MTTQCNAATDGGLSPDYMWMLISVDWLPQLAPACPRYTPRGSPSPQDHLLITPGGHHPQPPSYFHQVACHPSPNYRPCGKTCVALNFQTKYRGFAIASCGFRNMSTTRPTCSCLPCPITYLTLTLVPCQSILYPIIYFQELYQ